MKSSNRCFSLLAAFLCGLTLVASASDAKSAKIQNRDAVPGSNVTILVTAHPHNRKETEVAGRLTADDFIVKENDRPQKVLSVRPAADVPLMVEVLIQDNLQSRMNNEIRGVKRFIKSLPNGSRVLTGYLTTGTIDVRQDFTTDRDRAAASLRILTDRAPYNPYVEVIEGLKRFDSQPEGRRIIVLISDGLDLSHGFEDANPELSIDLDLAIREAQRRGVAIFSLFEPGAGFPGVGRLEVTFGQGSLIKISNETGGEAFLGPPDVVSLSPYWTELQEQMSRQWIITYQSVNTGPGFRRISVAAESGMHLHYPRGYWVK
jgi:VWFA-related protein